MPKKSLMNVFSRLKDFRGEPQFDLLEMIVIALCAILCGAESWGDVVEWGKDNEAWLKKYLKLPNGTASYYTFRRVFWRLNAKVFKACLRKWVMSLGSVVVAIDGKTARGSRDGPNTALHMIRGFVREGVRGKAKEIEDVKALLETLMLKGCIVTMDALGYQTGIARKIAEWGEGETRGDGCLPVRWHKYRVTLRPEEKEMLESLLRDGESTAYQQTRARILLKAADGETDKETMKALSVSAMAVYRTRQRCVEQGVEAALQEKPRYEYRVTLRPEEKEMLESLLRDGESTAYRQTRARILLKAADGETGRESMKALSVSASAVYRTRQKFVNEGVEAALREKPRHEYRVTLKAEEKEMLESLLRDGESTAYRQTQARILLKAAAGEKDKEIMKALSVSAVTVYRTRQKFVNEGVEAALQEKSRPGKKPKLTEKQGARIVALAYTPAPEGHDRWTLRLLADRVVQLGYAESFSYEAVRCLLKKHSETLASIRKNGVFQG
ncbi:MAG: ISAs1 family transposase [Candidatus Accumulibacter sp.]|jgi:transposase|nr:ISAs1 family transposase [Accumulibacter sp.]